MIPFEFHEGHPSDGSGHRIVVPKGLESKTGLFAFLRQALPLPDYFGGNWDALEECLIDLDWSTHPKIILVHQDLPLKNKPAEQKTYLEILTLAVQESGRLHVVFPGHARHEIEQLLSAPK